MNKHKEEKKHPEVADIEHICDITPSNPQTGDVCDKVNKHKDSKQKIKSNPKAKKT
ncbi:MULTISPECIES: hypothetical protein [Legionella]|uniref:Uncharacterized protein n=1 Tax=Legionella resiliens TaxID=2905958 RepID=A0ABS8X483_9GAMM|nr:MULTISPECIES: hypothetical protein [unclassified Legionella]MCE0724423.1 hypothetical protein [Legionella sp. 9fVS26]MCE3533575.1 hypothetical protein [Legionella sp. 8cVS16]QLZ69765.1 hypothetical protein FOLKNPGA_02563 [Legionella sp. PC1000]